MGRGRRHEEGLDTLELKVDLGHLKFVIKVCNGTKALNDNVDLVRFTVINEQPRPGINADVGENLGDFANHLDALWHGEEGALGIIYKNGNDHLIEHLASALDNVEVAKCDGIKGSGTDNAFHGKTLAE